MTKVLQVPLLKYTRRFILWNGNVMNQMCQ